MSPHKKGGRLVEDQMKLRFEIRNNRPVELLDLARSMTSLGAEYRRFLGVYAPELRAADFKLYVREVRSGSVITELAAIAPYALPLVEHLNTIADFSTWLNNIYQWLLGKTQDQPEPIDKTTLSNVSQILEPVAKDNGAQLNIGAVNVNGNLYVNMTLDTTEANAVQNRAKREMERLLEPLTGPHYSVVFHWAQARNNMEGISGDRGRIESLYAGSVKVRFDTEDLKRQMLYDPAHPFEKAFLVDVIVETVNGKPVLYKVFRLHEVLQTE